MSEIKRTTVRYDPGCDMLYLFVREGIEDRFVEVADGILVELDESGQLLGIELHGASQLLPSALQTQGTLTPVPA